MTTKQRAYLKSLAMTMDPVFQIGKNCVTPEVTAAVSEALEARELIDHHRTRGLYFDNIEIPIDTNSEGFRLITRIQDEAHRFAIEYHRSLRSKEQVHSVLDDIPGIGERRRKALMRRYRSIEGIRDATVEELAETESMNIGSAKQVYEFFHPNK